MIWHTIITLSCWSYVFTQLRGVYCWPRLQIIQYSERPTSEHILSFIFIKPVSRRDCETQNLPAYKVVDIVTTITIHILPLQLIVSLFQNGYKSCFSLQTYPDIFPTTFVLLRWLSPLLWSLDCVPTSAVSGHSRFHCHLCHCFCCAGSYIPCSLF